MCQRLARYPPSQSVRIFRTGVSLLCWFSIWFETRRGIGRSVDWRKSVPMFGGYYRMWWALRHPRRRLQRSRWVQQPELVACHLQGLAVWIWPITNRKLFRWKWETIRIRIIRKIWLTSFAKSKMQVLEDGKQQVQVIGLIDSVVNSIEDVFKLIIFCNNPQTLEVIARFDEL